jgi:hypothetical protein
VRGGACVALIAECHVNGIGLSLLQHHDLHSSAFCRAQAAASQRQNMSVSNLLGKLGAGAG